MTSSLLLTITIIFTIITITRLSISGSVSSSSSSSDGGDGDTRKPRIRREIRELKSYEWQRIVNAMNIMKSTSNEDGKKIYGDRFETYDSLVCRHNLAAVGVDGDQGHFTQVFFTFHRVMILYFEEILRAIDPKIEAVPYWDYRLDTELADLSTSVIFSDKYFGSLVGTGDGYAVVDGKFGCWKVHDDPSKEWDDNGNNIITCPAKNYVVRNPYGLLRGPLNYNDNRYVTRQGGDECGKPSAYPTVGSIPDWDKCVNESPDMQELDNCIIVPVHNPAHIVIGGQKPLANLYDPDQAITPNSNCFSWILNGADVVADEYDDTNRIGQYGYNFGCFTCEWDGDASYECKIGIDPIEDCAQKCDLANVGGECTTTGGLTWDIPGLKTDQWMFGDFADFPAANNDPIWWFHHANMDKLLTEWQQKQIENGNNNDKSPYYGFPKDGWPFGQNLEDPICGNNGCEFYDFLSQYLDGNKGPYTHKDLLFVARVNGGIYAYE